VGGYSIGHCAQKGESKCKTVDAYHDYTTQ